MPESDFSRSPDFTLHFLVVTVRLGYKASSHSSYMKEVGLHPLLISHPTHFPLTLSQPVSQKPSLDDKLGRLIPGSVSPNKRMEILLFYFPSSNY